MAITPIWTARTAAGISGFFEVIAPPMTVSVDGLARNEVVHVRAAGQDGNTPVPFRSGGNVQLDYNHTKIVIITKGRYCLELLSDPAGPIDAHRE